MTSRPGRPTGPDDGDGHVPTPEQLDALLGGGRSGSDALDALVSAARADGRTDELAGLDAAVAAMAAPPAPLSRTRRIAGRIGAATLATKIATAAVGAAAIGGVAVAGATGHFPGQGHRSGGGTPASSTAPSASPSGGSGTRSGSGLPSTSASATASAVPSGSATASAPASGSPSADQAVLVARCAQWLALPSGSTAAQDAPRFRVLITAAGGRAEVTAFCLGLRASLGPSASSSTTGPSPSPASSLPSSSPSTSRSGLPSRSATPTGGRTTG